MPLVSEEGQRVPKVTTFVHAVSASLTTSDFAGLLPDYDWRMESASEAVAAEVVEGPPINSPRVSA